MTGAAFTDDGIKARDDLTQFRIVHFATHGLLRAPREDCPPQPALLTSFGGPGSDGLLSFAEIFDLGSTRIWSSSPPATHRKRGRRRGDARGRDHHGGDFALDGLVRAFVGAGGRSVVASHWPVPDDYDATKRLISGLFAASPGVSTAAALRQAQRTLMDDPATSHPYYWSGFAIVGDGARPVVPGQGGAAGAQGSNKPFPFRSLFAQSCPLLSGGIFEEIGSLLAAVAWSALALGTIAGAQTTAPRTAIRPRRPPPGPPDRSGLPVRGSAGRSRSDLTRAARAARAGRIPTLPPSRPCPGPSTRPRRSATRRSPSRCRARTSSRVRSGPGAGDGDDRPGDRPLRARRRGPGQVDLTGRFRDLSALQDARGEAVNGAMVVARAREDEALAIRLLRSEGYYDAVAAHAIEQIPGEGDTPPSLRVVISAVPGQRYRFGEIRIDGPATEPANIAREALPLVAGEPILAAEVEAAEANVLLRLPQQGYPFPEIGLRDVLLDPETGAGDYTLPLNPGPRARFGGFTTEGDLAFGPKHVDVLARFERGDLYDRRRVDDLREAMVATRLFTSVAAEPVRTGEVAEDGTEYVNILVRQDAGPMRSLDASAGFSTGEGFRLEGAWEHRNLFRPKVRSGPGRRGTQEHPPACASAATIGASATVRCSPSPRRGGAIMPPSAAIRCAFGPRHPRIDADLAEAVDLCLWRRSPRTNESRFGEPNLSLGDAYFIGGLIGQLGYDRSNSLLDPTAASGWWRGSSRGFAARTDSTAMSAICSMRAHIIRCRTISSSPDGVRIGSIFGIPRDELAPSRRLYAGGGGSVRGFGYQRLGPSEVRPNPDFDPESPRTSRRRSPFPSVGAASTSSRSRAATASAITALVASSMPARSMRASIRRSPPSLRSGRRRPHLHQFRAADGRYRDSARPTPGEGRIAVYMSIGQAF